MPNDGIKNEIKIVEAYNNKTVESLTDKQQKIIYQIEDTVDKNDIILAEKIQGRHKPDIKFIIKSTDYKISVKKGSGNSVHQEKIDSFISFCEEYLDMPQQVKEALLLFVYGDGTIDGSGALSDRLNENDVVEKYLSEVKLVESFFQKNAVDLIERFLVTGRYGRETGLIAEYLYHGTEKEGLICPLYDDTIHYLSNIKFNDSSGIHIGPMTMQTWNRNLSGRPDMEKRRDSIQVKCGSKFPRLINKVNEYLQNLPRQNDDEFIHNRWNNSHGFKNQKYLVNALNNKKYKDLNMNLRNLVKSAFPSISNDDIILAKRISNNKIKPVMKIIVNDIEKYFSVKMGKGNSVHQERVESFISFCEEHLNMSEHVKEALLLFLYGDGTTDGSGRISERLNEQQTIVKMGKKFDILNTFFYKNRRKLAERFLREGAYLQIPSDFLYYGTEQIGISVSYKDIINYLCEAPYQEKKLSIGSLTVQTWNRNQSGDKDFEYKRNSIQVKWKNIEDDINQIQLKQLEDFVVDGIQAEYELVSILNRIKSPKYSLWKEICSNLKLSKLDNIYAVRVTNRIESKLSHKRVSPKSDLYLIRANYTSDFLKSCNYWLDEDYIEGTDYNIISESGISCKLPSSKSFTYQKLTIDSFNKLFDDKFLGCGISLFVNHKDIGLNKSIMEKWSVTDAEMAIYFSDKLDTIIEKNFDKDLSVCKAIKNYSTSQLSKIINNDSKIQDIIFKGKGIYEDPYWSNYIYHKGLLEKISIPKFSVTNGSGRHKGVITIVIKPK